MGYYYTSDPEIAVPPKFCATPKTHTPGSPVKERGHRYFSPEIGTWVSRDPIGERGGVNLYVGISNDSVNHNDPLGLMTGNISVTVFHEYRQDSFLSHERGWKSAVAWSPPTGGDWDKPCECKPCKKVIWFQQARWHIYQTPFDINEPMHEEWDAAWAISRGFYGDCAGSTFRNAVMDDDPSVWGVTLVNKQLWTFNAVSYVKCVEGPEAGTIYGWVIWDAQWNAIEDAISSTGAVAF